MSDAVLERCRPPRTTTRVVVRGYATASLPLSKEGMATEGSIAVRDVILSARHVAPRRPRETPEQRLLIAVLQDAIHCLERYRFATDRHGRRQYQEVRRWVLAGESRRPCSFEGICGVLDLDPNVVRLCLARRLTQHRRPPPRRHSPGGPHPSDAAGVLIFNRRSVPPTSPATGTARASSQRPPIGGVSSSPSRIGTSPWAPPAPGAPS